MLPLRVVRKKIGELLLQRNVITLQQLNAALEEQKKKGGYLSQHLIALGFASELDIAHCLSNQYNFAYLPLKNYNIPREILRGKDFLAFLSSCAAMVALMALAIFLPIWNMSTVAGGR